MSHLKERPTVSVKMRTSVGLNDVEAVREIVTSTGFFSLAEIEVAVELVQERLTHGADSGYHFVFVDNSDRTVGYSCYGPIACTVGSFDLYWIAVHEDLRGQGIGAKLLQETENRIVAADGRGIYVETASRRQYEPTRRFYERNGYLREATLKDFYTIGDDKVVYSKRVAT